MLRVAAFLCAKGPVMQVWRIEQPSGDGGTRTTLAVMRALILRQSSDPLVRSVVSKLVQGVAPRDGVGQLRVIRHFLESYTTFLRDPRTVELVHTPHWMLQQIERHGLVSVDCDDVAVLAATLASAIGYPVRLVAVALDAAGRPFSHVWAEARDRAGVWVDFDVTRSAQGLDTARITRSLTVSV